MQTIHVERPVRPQPTLSVPSSSTERPDLLRAGSRGIWKDTRTKPLAA
ncbi:hypothetical protein [uncultured Deinococcus sp.]|nr:hypothetical protein [uncultured Deinococcus sp.]